MGSIREVTKKNSEKSFHAEVRLRGFPPERRVCRTKTKAKEWIQDTESAIRDGRFKNQSVSRKHSVGDLIDRFAANSIPKHPIYYPKKVQLLNRWKEELGHCSYQNYPLPTLLWCGTSCSLKLPSRSPYVAPQQE